MRAYPPGCAPDAPPRLFRGAQLPRCPTAWICRWESELQGQGSCSVAPRWRSVEPGEAQAFVHNHHLLVVSLKVGKRRRIIKTNKQKNNRTKKSRKRKRKQRGSKGKVGKGREQATAQGPGQQGVYQAPLRFLLPFSQAALGLVSNPSFLHLSNKMKWPCDVLHKIAVKVKTLYWNSSNALIRVWLKGKIILMWKWSLGAGVFQTQNTKH